MVASVKWCPLCCAGPSGCDGPDDKPCAKCLADAHRGKPLSDRLTRFAHEVHELPAAFISEALSLEREHVLSAEDACLAEAAWTLIIKYDGEGAAFDGDGHKADIDSLREAVAQYMTQPVAHHPV